MSLHAECKTKLLDAEIIEASLDKLLNKHPQLFSPIYIDVSAAPLIIMLPLNGNLELPMPKKLSFKIGLLFSYFIFKATLVPKAILNVYPLRLSF